MHELVFFYPIDHQAHFEKGHPERPERVETMRQSFSDAGWWDVFPLLSAVEPSIEVLSAIHTMDYLRILEAASSQGRHLDMDTYTTTESFKLALESAGGAIAVGNAVWQGNAKRGFSLCRPPGHHATPSRGMGFCLLNNVAIAAEYILQTFGAQKLAIVDLDLHHGNGTQDIFWRRPDVLYISTHQSPHYPGTGLLHETGAGAGEEFTANFPMPPTSGDVGFNTIMDECILPLIDRFTPEMVLVSYGFDTHWRDPLGNLLLSAGGYGSLIRSLTNWADDHCGGRIMLVLEGGYDLQAAAECGLSVTSALLGEEWEDKLGPSPFPEGDAWRTTLAQAKSIWAL